MDEKKPTTASGTTDGQKIRHTPCPSTDTSVTSPTTFAAQSHNIPTGRRIIQNFRLIWLDTNMEKSDDDFHNFIPQLQCVVNTIDVFTDADLCVDFLTEIKSEKILMIVSGSLGKHIISIIHDVSQLSSIFIFCENKTSNEQWAKDWSKVRGIFTEIGPICDSLKQAARQCDQETISISFVSTGETSNQNLNQLDQSFMYTQILKEILLAINYEEQFIKKLADYCRDQYAGNEFELNSIGKFQRKYRHESPIWWYTHECFLYPMLNRALRTQEVDTIIKMGFFIRDLHRNIQDLHSEQFGGHQVPFTVYRGQGLLRDDLEKLMKTQNGLMSFNNFLSTSIDREVSLAFADSNRDNPDLTGILFQITIDPSISTAPFALVNMVSHFQSEQEILFSMHTVFRIGEIKNLDDSNRLWQVELKATSDNDQQLSVLTERMREEIGGSGGWIGLGQLLIKLDEFNLAEQVYRELLEHNTSSINARAYCYHHLAAMKAAKGDYAAAIALYKNIVEIANETLPSHDLAASYNNIGFVYMKMGKYSKALSFYDKALKINEKALPPNHPHLAASYSNIGSVYTNMGDVKKALPFHEKALEMRKKSLPPNHPDLAISYSNIGSAYKSIGEDEKALTFHEKALGIREKTLSPNHPDLATSYNNIGFLYMHMGEHSKALSFEEKALKIRQTLSPNHPDLATSYNNIGVGYLYMGEYLKALSFHEKALEIREKTLPSSHPHLATSYSNIGSVYTNMGDVKKALPFHENALEMRKKSLPPNHPDLATSYDNIGLVYKSMGEDKKALSFHEKALEIREKTLPPNHLHMATSYSNICSVYKNMGEDDKALSFYEKAREIKETHSQSHPCLQTTRQCLEIVKNKE